MTRAHLSCLKGDFLQALKYNPLFFLGIPFIYLLLFQTKSKKYEKIYNITIAILFISFFVMNFLRIFNLFGLQYIK
jgi:hypothetical protein